MNWKLISITFLGLSGVIWPAAEAPSIQLKPQSSISALDAIADPTHGVLKWSNGAFLYMDAANGVPPAFHTLNRDGSLSSSTSLQIPGASQFWYGGYDRGADGSIVFAGGTYSAYGEAAPFIAWISPDGRTQRITRTGVYYAHMISVAPDGTIWTMGCEMINHKTDDPGLDPNAGVLRHFDTAGKLIGSFFPQSGYVRQDIRLVSGYLVAKRDRIAWYSPRWGRASQYIEIPLESMKKTVYPGLPAPATGGMVDGFGLTDDGTASLSMYDPKASKRWTTYTLDRGASQWIPTAQLAVAGEREPHVVGSDGNQFVLLSGSKATFYSLSQ